MERVLRGIRGAVCAASNTADAIEAASRRLVEAIARDNGIGPDQVVSAIFTVTPDLDAQFPAVGARQAGWDHVALLCAREIPVPGSLSRCIRVLVHAYVPADQPVHHVYLGEAARLRPEWTGSEASDGRAVDINVR